MNVVDSSAWLEYFADGPNADHFAQPLSAPDTLLVPTVCIYEVFKVILRESGEDNALQAFAAMQKGNIVDLNPRLAIAASKIGLQHGLPMADSIILATARPHKATIWTQDRDFENIPNVRYFAKRPG